MKNGMKYFSSFIFIIIIFGLIILISLPVNASLSIIYNTEPRSSPSSPALDIEIDFNILSYGPLNLNVGKWIAGDTAWANNAPQPAGIGYTNLATIRNIGSADIQISITQDDMALGTRLVNGVEQWNVRYGVRMGGEGGEFIFFNPNEKITMGTIPAGATQQLDFFINVLKARPGKTSYQGTMVLSTPIGTSYQLTTSVVVRSGGGSSPIILCKWETPDDADSGHIIPGTQIVPLTPPEMSKQIQLYLVVTDDEDWGEIANAYADIWYPAGAIENASFKRTIELFKMSYGDGIAAVQTGNTQGLITFNSVYNYASVINMAQKGTAAVWTGWLNLDNKQPLGDSSVACYAADHNSNYSNILENRFSYGVSPGDTTPPAAVRDLRTVDLTGIDLTSTGFVYPTGEAPTRHPPLEYPYGGGEAKNYYQNTSGGWLARGDCDYNHDGNYDYSRDYYHIGQDIKANENDSVYAITDGEIIYVSADFIGWGSGNYGLIIRHKLISGEEFIALYGHVRPNIKALRYAASGSVNPPVSLKAGEAFSTIGPWTDGPHLHFGIHPDLLMPKEHWGKMPISSWPKDEMNKPPTEKQRNGFVDPIKWIQNQTPRSPVHPWNSVTLIWTAPENDSGDITSGPVSKYDIRYSTQKITEDNWKSAKQCTGEPNPGDPGSTDTFVVPGLSLATVYYFAVRAYDDAGNPSGLSFTQGVTAGIYMYLCSAADILVTDPDGLTISKKLNEIPGATYMEVDIDGDGDLDDQVTIQVPKRGDYLVAVVPEPSASPKDTYTLGISAGGVNIVLANHVQISNIPSQGYIVRSTKSGITNWDYSFKDSTRGTKIYINTLNGTFQFIAPDKEFLIKKATRMKIIDFSKEKEPPIKYDSDNKKWKMDSKKLDIDDDLKPFAEQHQFNQRPERIILINHKDSDLQLSAVVVDGEEDSCVAIARDLKTKRVYMLIVKPELKRFPKK